MQFELMAWPIEHASGDEAFGFVSAWNVYKTVYSTIKKLELVLLQVQESEHLI